MKMSPMYEYTDKILKVLLRKYIRVFGNAKGNLIAADELNVLSYSKAMYGELEQYTERYLLKLAKKIYSENLLLLSQDGISVKDKSSKVNQKWLTSILSAYDPVTMYVYLNETDRKEARFAESVISSQNRGREIEKALRLWSNMNKQYANTVTDKAVLQAYKDNGIEKVIWLTVPDERRCKECRDLDGEIFDIDDIPPKPHLYCRCWYMPYFGSD